MCGIAGMIGPDIKGDDHKFMKDLLYVLSLRGKDSTGVMIAGLSGRKKWLEVDKKAIPSTYWLRQDWLKQSPMLEDYAADLFMTHCRDATVGVVNEANAHPFNLTKIVGAHNGTLVDGRYRGTGKTDSEEMFIEMDKNGVLPTLRNLSQNSAYAISVYHKGTTKISLARNKKRPLFIGLNTERKVIYWASEEHMITMCAARNDIKVETYYLQEDQLYTFDATKLTGKDEPQWEQEDIVYTTPPPTKVIQWNKSPTGVWVPPQTTDTTTSSTTTTTINGKPVIRTINAIGRVEEHDVPDLTNNPQYSESYFDSVFDKVLKGETPKEPLIFTQDLSEADFDHDGNPLPHVQHMRPDDLDDLRKEQMKKITKSHSTENNSHAALERLFSRGSAVMDIHPEDDGPNYAAQEDEKEMWWDDQCTVCNRFLKTRKDLDEAVCVVVDGANYYSCKKCEDDIIESVERQRNRRRPDYDETVETH